MSKHFAFIALCISPLFSFAAKVDTLMTFSKSMNREIASTIILPDSYDSLPTSGVLYPTVYILHGGGGNHGNWLKRMPQLTSLADKYEMVFVFPDAGSYSWYLDHPLDPSSQYETYITDELVNSVECAYRVSRSGTKRAITGLSMGGHGAIYLALRQPKMFAAAGSMSGVLDFALFPNRKGMDKFNDIRQHSVAAIAADFNTELHEAPALIFDCGTEDLFLPSNRSLKAILESQNLEFSYSERKGTHNWNYWRTSILDHLEFFYILLK